MENLTALLEFEGRKRGLLAPGERATAKSAFALVRDMPYRRASDRRPESVVREWQGTCSGKHYLLDQIFRETGMDSRIIMCTHQFTTENTRHFPADLRALVAQQPVPDVHTYIRLHSGGASLNIDTSLTRGVSMTVDATWPSSAAPLGMPVNHSFTPGDDMTIACDPIDTFEVPPGSDPQAFKEDLIAEFCGASGRVRDDFIEGMSRWLADATRQ